jgi:hypothetical protein
MDSHCDFSLLRGLGGLIKHGGKEVRWLIKNSNKNS